jgi:hypothetical protein
LDRIAFNEEHVRVLSAFSRSDLEITLNCCKFTNAGTITLAEVRGLNQGPTKLDYCDFDNSVLADGLRGNKRLKSWIPLLSRSRDGANRELPAIAGALRENKGLVDLNLSYGLRLSDETWSAICDSLKAHPTIEILDLRRRPEDGMTAPAVLKFRIQALLDMVKINLSIHIIHLDSRYSEHELYRGSVIPYLETNGLRLRVCAIQKTRPIAYRAKVLGRAFLAARTNANSFWMLLSGNAEVAFPSTTASLPAPAIAAAASNAAVGRYC